MRRKTYCISLLTCAVILTISISTPAQEVPGLIDAAQPALRAEHVFDAKVTITDLLSIGKSKYGERRLIPITGGTFKGSNIGGCSSSGRRRLATDARRWRH